MSRLDDLDRMINELNDQEQKNEEMIRKAEEAKKMAEEDTNRVRENRRKAEEARAKYAEAEELYAEMGLSDNAKSNKKNKNNSGAARITALVLAGSILTGSVVYALTRKSYAGKVQTMPVASPMVSDTMTPEEVKDIITYDYEELTDEKFEELCALRIKELADKEIPVNEKDVITYVMGTNSDKLAEDNKAIIGSVVGDRADVEVLNDFGKVCAAIAMYDLKIARNSTTEGFILVSDSIFGEQKDLMIEVEKYVNTIVKSQGDNEKVNATMEELFDLLSSGKLSKLDDGVGFSMATYLMLFDAMDKERDITLNDSNRSMLDQLVTSEKYVSDILRVFGSEECKVLSK